MESLRHLSKKLSNAISFNHKQVIEEPITSIYDKKAGWCSGKEFSRILQMEIRRSYRTGSPISYVLLDLLAGSDGKYILSSNAYTKFLSELITVISHNSREFDVRGYTNPREIGIILIDTPIDGAKIFIKKISEEILIHFKSLEDQDLLNILSFISISTYPLNRISGTSTFVTKSMLIEHELSDNSSSHRSDKGDSLVDGKVIFNLDLNKIKDSSNGKNNLGGEVENGDFNTKISYRLIKRLIDIVGSIIGISLFLPLMIFISICVKLTSRGPILFKQKRMGYKGKLFTFIKYRSMSIDSNEHLHKDYVHKLIEGKNDEINMGSDQKPTYKITNDPRITALGHILRKTSLDELPQLFNVLLGQMSLVGPRPPIPYEVEMYKGWHLQRILEVKPGVTGLWQIEGRSSTTFDEMVRMDLQYVKKKSLVMDIKIILKTFSVVFKTEGAM